MPDYPFTGPIKISPIVERLRSTVPELDFVGRAPDMEAAMNSRQPVSPAAYVLLARDDAAKASGHTNRLVQVVTPKVSVVYTIRDYEAAMRDRREMAADEDLVAEILGKGRMALLGWRPEEATRDFHLEGGQVSMFKYGVLWWEDVYSLQYTVHK